MPQLVKGGKHVFGWTVVSARGAVCVPPEAAREYGLDPDDRSIARDGEGAVGSDRLAPRAVVLVPGSRTSGGFGVFTLESLVDSPLGAVLEAHPELGSPPTTSEEQAAVRAPRPASSESASELSTVVEFRGRPYSPATVEREEGGATIMNAGSAALRPLGVAPGDRLLVVRGSGLGVGLVARGPIVEEARRHPELDVFEVRS